MLRSAVLACALPFALLGCAMGGGTDGGGTDGSAPRVDGGPRVDAGTEACPAGQHRCGGGCIEDLDNVPTVGCRLGCGEACPMPPDGAASCDDSGMCTVGCTPPFRLVDGMCTCAPRTCADMGWMCGAPDDGCGSPLDCGSCGAGGTCSEGTCTCGMDTREPNDSFSTVDGVPLVASIPNENWRMSYDTLTIHDAADVDILRFHVEDSGLTSPDPTISVTLSAIPTGADYDLSAFYVCDEGGNDSTCAAGISDNERGVGCTSASAGSAQERVSIVVECTPTLSTNDSGILYVRVRANSVSAMCTPYNVEVDVAN